MHLKQHQKEQFKKQKKQQVSYLEIKLQTKFTEMLSNLNEEIRDIELANKFKKTILGFIRPKENSAFAIHDSNFIKLLILLRLNFTHLNYHKFSHSFRDIVDPMCKCCKEAETITPYLLRCNLHTFYRTELLNDTYSIDSSIKNYPQEKLLNILLYGSLDFNNDKNQDYFETNH